MNTRKSWMVAAMAALCLGVTSHGMASAGDKGYGSAHGGAGKPALAVSDKDQQPGRNVVQTAIHAGSFKTLVAAVQAAGLTGTLEGEGPFTVFAPTDEAFAKLPAGTVEELLKPENKAKLTAILTYHVIPGKVTAEQAVKLDSAKTVQGRSLAIKVSGDKVMVDQAAVVTTDVLASNGVIHLIDSVLIPQGM